MSKKRVGGQVDDIFASPAKGDADQPKKTGKGRPKVHDDIIKTMITLRGDQVFWLDRLALDIRVNSRAIIDRGLIIRALVDLAMKSGVDLTSVTNEEDLRAALKKGI